MPPSSLQICRLGRLDSRSQRAALLSSTGWCSTAGPSAPRTGPPSVRLPTPWEIALQTASREEGARAGCASGWRGQGKTSWRVPTAWWASSRFFLALEAPPWHHRHCWGLGRVWAFLLLQPQPLWRPISDPVWVTRALSWAAFSATPSPIRDSVGASGNPNFWPGSLPLDQVQFYHSPASFAQGGLG